MILRVAVAFSALSLLTLEGCFPGVGLAQSSRAESANKEAGRVGLVERVGNWKLARYVPGEHAHFLFVSERRAFSLFVSAMNQGAELKGQSGWRSVPLGKGQTGFLHQDARAPERNALAWRRGAQRWMILGRLKPDELISLATQL